MNGLQADAKKQYAPQPYSSVPSQFGKNLEIS